MTVRWAALASGSGTNLQALMDADLTPGRLVQVMVNNPGCGAEVRARAAGLRVDVVDHRGRSRDAFETELVERLTEAQVQWVVLAGFMRILGGTFLDAFPGRVINIHPSLLPAFPGIHAQQQALDAGVRIAGCTVHLADAGVDTGPILAQAAVPVLQSDSLETLRLRILEQEHDLLPRVVRAISEGRLSRTDRQVRWNNTRQESAAALQVPDGFPSKQEQR